MGFFLSYVGMDKVILEDIEKYGESCVQDSLMRKLFDYEKPRKFPHGSKQLEGFCKRHKLQYSYDRVEGMVLISKKP